LCHDLMMHTRNAAEHVLCKEKGKTSW